MIRDITIGQYYYGDSPIHRMDPRTKLIITFLYIISLFIYTNKYIYIGAVLFLALVISLSKVPFKYIVRGLKGVVILILFTVIFNLFLTGTTPLLTIGALVITKEGFRKACYMAVRLILLIIGSSIMTLTTTPNNLTDGLESVLKPLKLIKVPVHEISMMMSIALRFIPILIEETDKIMKAQLARGADFETGNIIKKTKSLVPVLVPLFISSFRRANDLAMAMESRCYRGDQGRTKMKPLKYNGLDYIAYVVTVGYMGIIIMSGKNGAYLDAALHMPWLMG